MSDHPASLFAEAIPADRVRLTVADQALVNIVLWMQLSRDTPEIWRELFRAELADLLPEVNRDNPNIAPLIAQAEKLVSGVAWTGWRGDLAASNFLRTRAVMAAQAARDAAGRDPTRGGEPQ